LLNKITNKVRFQENYKTADFELCTKGAPQFCKPKISN
jgi:hypothetical protein